jgi:DNA-binding NarL/FixJ family response regulator
LTDALADLVDGAAGLDFVGVARDCAEAVALALAREPDIVLVDLEMTNADAAQIAREVGIHLPGARIIALSTYPHQMHNRRALPAGLHRYLNKSTDLADLLPTLLEEHVFPT